MLGKLIKSEMKATGRYVGLVYLASLFATVFTAFLWVIMNVVDNNIYTSISMPINMMIGFVIIVAIYGGTALINYFRFYRTMVSDEGYLTHTLPVTVDQLLVSKLFVAVIYDVLRLIAIFALSAFIGFVIVVSSKNYSLPDIITGYQNLIEAMPNIWKFNIPIFIIEFALAYIFSMAQAMLMVYLALAIGQTMKSHKILWSIGIYIAISMAVSTITQIISTVVMFTVSLNMSFDSWMTEHIDTYFHIILWVSIIVSLLFGTIYYFITRYFFKNKLNLE